MIQHRVIALFLVLFLTIHLSAQEQKGPSSKSRMIYKTMKSVNASEKIFDRLIHKPKRGTNKVSGKKIKRGLMTEVQVVDGFKVLTIQNSSSLNKHIIILHGGAYVSEGLAGHRVLMEKLALDYNFKVSYIDYPLAPENTAGYTHEILWKAFEVLIDSNGEDEFFLFGDSAGGGLALSFLQILRDKHVPEIPVKTVLLSPWLDISMSHPEIADFIEKDVLLDFEGLKECGRLYAGELDVKDPLVSPIFGEMDNLNTIKVFVSTHELFYPDCILFQKKLESAQGSTVDLCVKSEMIHDWIIMPIDERDETIREIAKFLLMDTFDN